MLKYNDEQKGYDYISDSGIVYSLYEGVSIPMLIDQDERKTSDIVFIVLDEYVDFNTRFVNFVYGADFLGRDKDIEDLIKTYVDRFEAENEDLIEQIRQNITTAI